MSFPHVSFLGVVLDDHSYVDLKKVGNADDGTNSIQCIADMISSCHVGWYFPNGTELKNSSQTSVYQYHLSDACQVHLRRPDTIAFPSGIYRCDTSTTARIISLYVGIYYGSADRSQVFITCVSTGGPATNVTWTKDSVTITEGTETVLDNAVTAKYIHTLTGNARGEYKCYISNHKSSPPPFCISIEGASAPTDLLAVQNGPISVLVTWSGSSDANGYIIFYESSIGNVTSVDVVYSSYELSDLQEGATYYISIVATSSYLQSERVTASMAVTLHQLNLSIISTTAISIKLSINYTESMINEFILYWERDTSIGCSDEDKGMTTASGRMKNITNLQESST
jgi:hypothetical protein